MRLCVLFFAALQFCLLSAFASTQPTDSQLVHLDTLAGKIVYAHPDSTILLAHRGLQLAKQLGDDRMVMRMYTHISNAWQLQGRFDSVNVYNTLLWEKARASRDTLMMVTALGKIGSLQYLSGHVDSAIHSFQQSLELIPHLEEKYQRGLLLTSHANLGMMYQPKGDLASASRHFAEALRFAPEGCHPDRVNLLNVQATLYFDLEFFERAEKLLEKALACSTQNPNLTRIAIVVLNNLGELQLKHYNDPRQAITFFDRAIEQNEGKFTQSLLFSLAGKAEAYIKLNEPDSARMLLRQAASHQMKSPETASWIHMLEASLALAENDLPLAKKKAAQAIEIAETAGLTPTLRDAYRTWLSAALKMKSDERLADWFDRFVALNDSIDRTRLVQRMALLEAEQINANMRDSLYRERVEKAYLESIHSTQRTLLWVSMLLLLLASIIAWSWFKQWRLSEARRQALLEQNRHLTQLRAQGAARAPSASSIDDIRTQKFHPDNGQWAVQLCQISHISSSGNLITFHLTDGTTRQMWGSLSSLIEVLPSSMFARCYQSNLVNFEAISEVRANEIRLKSGVTLKIGRTYKKDFAEKWKEYIER